MRTRERKQEATDTHTHTHGNTRAHTGTRRLLSVPVSAALTRLPESYIYQGLREVCTPAKSVSWRGARTART